MVLMSGVVLLTHKKPESSPSPADRAVALRKRSKIKLGRKDSKHGEEVEVLREDGEGELESVVWDVGEVSDEEDGGGYSAESSPQGSRDRVSGVEGQKLIDASESGRAGEAASHRTDPFRDDPEELD